MKYDLEERTLNFAIKVRKYVSKVKFTSHSSDDLKQIVRSSGSIGANYVEGNLSLGDKDFLMRIRISRKEASETKYWAKILSETLDDHAFLEFEKEASELEKIFGSILTKFNKKS